jgi:outer membrane protein assembly factor BamB
MIPFTRRIDPALARFLVSTCRGIVIVASAFSVAVAAVLVASAVQLALVNPLENPAVTALRERYHASPNDQALAEDIRTLDLAARRLYFTREWQIRTAAWMLAIGVGVVLAGLRAAGSLAKRLPSPSPAASEDSGMGSRSVRIALGVMATVVLFAGLTAAAFDSWRGTGTLVQTQSDQAATAQAVVLAGEMKANWPQFRGPGGNGIAEDADPPVDWDGPSGRGIAWSAAIPLPGRGSPVVWEGQVYLSGANEYSREVYCWNAATGALVWKQSIPLAPGAPAWPPKVEKTVGYAASTMAANASGVVVMFANGDLTAISHDGKILWSRHCGEPKLNYGYASSPAVASDAVIVQFDAEEGGTLLALRAADGAVLWETKREVQSSWASPAIVSNAGRWIILAQGRPFLAAYDAQKGTALWLTPGMMGENAPSPAYAGGRVIAGNQLLALSAVDAASGKVLWETFDDFPDVASPLAFGDMVLMAASYGVVTCLDAASGKVLWKEVFDDGFYASPVAAVGRFYLLDRSGVMRIMAAKRTEEMIRWERSRKCGSPVRCTVPPAYPGPRRTVANPLPGSSSWAWFRTSFGKNPLSRLLPSESTRCWMT